MQRVSMQAGMMAVVSSLAATSTVLAQMPEGVQRSSSPQGFQVQGTTAINTVTTSSNAVAIGKENAATNAVGAGKGNVQIQGTTRINAAASNTNAAAVGQDNKASNALGAIGAK